MFDYLKENRWFLGLCLAGIVIAVLGFSSLAKAQTPTACYSRTVMDVPIQVCPGDGLYEVHNLSTGTIRVRIDTGTVDLRTCNPELTNDVVKTRCSTGLYEWERQGVLLRLRLIPEVSIEEAQRLIYLERQRFWSSDYGYVPPECGVLIERNTQRCVDARWRRNRVARCFGPYSGRPVYEAETCLRWEQQRRDYY